MIRSFADKMTAALYLGKPANRQTGKPANRQTGKPANRQTGKPAKRLPPQLRKRAREKLDMIDQAQVLNDLRVPPANRLEALQGDRSGQYSIRINDQWRVCFRWSNGDAYDVEITDYH